MSKNPKTEDVKSTILDAKTGIVYHRGSFLGKGGFARCYEFKNSSTNEVFAGKVVSKSILVKPHHREKMVQEIRIHSTLAHKHIVKLHSYFEDESNMYIVLELCRKRSLMEMHKRRKTLLPTEVRYFLKQIVLACEYMHERKVIHRDLKLGNLFISENMEIKVGDFGLATRLAYDGERKQTLCGTPNYIAPEILNKQGHSFEVDIWSLGCIMYTLLVGRPPFETSSLKTTYQKIKNNQYNLPQTLEPAAKSLIMRLLHKDPSKRPSAAEILADPFFEGYIPTRLPQSCLIMHPRTTHNMTLMDETRRSVRRPLGEKNALENPFSKVDGLVTATEKLDINGEANPAQANMMPKDYFLKDLLCMIDDAVKPGVTSIYQGNPENCQDPSAVPFVWVSKWVDYTDKYGVGYQLCENSIGVFFNDVTHLVLLADQNTLQYIDRNGKEFFYSREDVPQELSKKLTLLNYFRTYMTENLLTAGDNAKPREGDEMAQVPHLRAWLRSNTAIVFHLTNGTFQANFFNDHTKIILCPVMGAVSYIDEDKNFSIYTFKLIKEFGCPPFLASRLRYARSMIKKLYMEYRNSHRPAEKK